MRRVPSVTEICFDTSKVSFESQGKTIGGRQYVAVGAAQAAARVTLGEFGSVQKK